jgi:spore photoproduct lyase
MSSKYKTHNWAFLVTFACNKTLKNYLITMLIYYETKVKDLPITKEIFDKFWDSEKIEIQHYKNLFDIKIWQYTTEPFIILAKQEHIAILPTPKNYWFPWKSFFFKPSLNCFFRCKYCYLQWTFKNRFPVFFLNYEDMQKEILNQINKEREKWFNNQITFYASNYADLLATEDISHFHKTFLPFCETLPENVIIETRTKSANITPLLDYAKNLKWRSPTSKMEIAFSLSPREIAQDYELWTATLDQKLNAIKQLFEKGFRVWLRFLPLLPVQNFREKYSIFLDEITSTLPIEKVSSITIAPLIFNEWDYNVLIKKYKDDSDFSFISHLKKNNHNLRTCSDEEINIFKNLFEERFKWSNIFWDYI